MNSKYKHNMFLKLLKYRESIKCDKNISVRKHHIKKTIFFSLQPVQPVSLLSLE